MEADIGHPVLRLQPEETAATATTTINAKNSFFMLKRLSCKINPNCQKMNLLA
jgi:hypothetical protein